MSVTRTGELVVRAPILMSKFIIDKFVFGHTKWIAKQSERAVKPAAKLIPYFDSLPSLEKFIREKVLQYTSTTGLKPSGIKFRKVKSYWGSCSPEGIISFNIHLKYAPLAAVEYVVVHEMCHLKYRGHGVKFWKLVQNYFPKTKEMRSVLRHIARN